MRDSSFIPICEENADYKKYLDDIDDGVKVIDEPYLDSEILDAAKQNAIAKVNKKIYSDIILGFEYQDNSGDMCKCDKVDQINYLSMLLKKDKYTEMMITLLNGEERIVPKQDIDALTDAAWNHVKSIRMAGKDVKNQIRACDTKEEIDAILETL